MQEQGPVKISRMFSFCKLLAKASSDFAFVKQILDSTHPLSEEGRGKIRAKQLIDSCSADTLRKKFLEK